MIQSDQPLPVTRRCELLKVARSTAYCRPGPVSHEDLVLMRLIDEIHLEPFRYYRHGVRTVHLDGCVEVEAAYYSAPPGWIGQRVQVQWDGARVRLLAPTTGVLLREHLRSPRGWHRIHDADRPARTPRSTLTLLARATRAGPGIGTICEHIHQHDGAVGIRRILGVLALSSKSTGRPPSRTPPRRRWTSACPPTAFCGAISTADRPLHFRCARSIP